MRKYILPEYTVLTDFYLRKEDSVVTASGDEEPIELSWEEFD